MSRTTNYIATDLTLKLTRSKFQSNMNTVNIILCPFQNSR